jgi:uncharacterized membrane protein YhaH (DUF805 family)
MNWYIEVVKKYAVFNGRARRKEYWMFVLFYMIIAIVLGILDAVLRLGFLGAIFGLAMLLPGLGVSIRRLHDTGRTGWWILIGLVPLIGFIVLLVFYCQDSQAGDNEYGPNPKQGEAAA